MIRKSILFALPLLAVTTPAAAQTPDFSKVQIKAETLAPGVAVLFGAGGNIGVSHGPDGTILIDDQFAPLTDKIAAAVAALGASPVRFLVNTHWHFDHSGGNENFGKTATILAHKTVRVRLAAGAKTRFGDIPAAAPQALPVITYDDGVTFHLNGDEIAAVFTGGGHTDGDTALYWRKANILHTGDLMMSNAPFPFVDLESGGNALHLVATLDKLLAMTNSETKVIPGHGPVTTRVGLKEWRDRIAGGVDMVRKAKVSGQKLEAFLAANPMKPLDRPGAFINSDAFARAIWASLDAMPADHGHAH